MTTSNAQLVDDWLVRARDVTVRHGSQRVLDRVGIELRRGEIVTIIGLNGAGKSTLLRVLLGLIRPDAGTVERAPGLRIGFIVAAPELIREARKLRQLVIGRPSLLNQRTAALFLSTPNDGRVFFLIPWKGGTLIGTTDTPFRGSPDRVRPSADDIRYLIRSVNELLPSAALRAASASSFSRRAFSASAASRSFSARSRSRRSLGSSSQRSGISTAGPLSSDATSNCSWCRPGRARTSISRPRLWPRAATASRSLVSSCSATLGATVTAMRRPQKRGRSFRISRSTW